MAFPASVNQLGQTRKRVRKPRFPRSRSPDGVVNDVSSGIGVGGPSLDFGRDGSARLVRERGKWKWDWINKGLKGMSAMMIHV